MKPSFNIEDESLKKHSFPKKVGQEEEIRARILEQTVDAGNDNALSNRVAWAAAAAVAVFVGLFGILSQIDYSISVYDTTKIAQQDAEQYYTYELNELSLSDVSAELDEIDVASASMEQLTATDIIKYLSYEDLTTYELSEAL